MSHDELVRRALEVRDRAYAPYSGFHVGAAVLTTEGDVFVGANVENSSYGLTICAERSAIAAAASAGARKLAAIAVVSGPGALMCGACRQVVGEFADESTEIVLADARGNYDVLRIEELLPGG